MNTHFKAWRRFLHYLHYVILCSLCLPGAAHGQINVLTQHNDNGRTGQNLSETILNTASVNSSTFGKLFARQVDGNIYAQPLYVSDLTMTDGVHNVIFVATSHNTVYAFDADDEASSDPLWSVNLGQSVPAQDICVNVPPPQCPYTDVVPEIGIIATPAIDLTTGTIYVTSNTKDEVGVYHWTLHALDLSIGTEKAGAPVEITAAGFEPLQQLNRPGLLLANGNVYIAFGSVGDYSPWHGWVMAYNAATLQQTAWYSTTPNGNGSGIWQSGNGLLSDSDGNIYGVTGNGSFDLNTGGPDVGSAYLKLNGSDLSLLDYFAPSNQSLLNSNNKDLGSGGGLLIPGTSLLLGAAKDGTFHLVSTDSMGGFNPTSDNDVQEFTAARSPVLGSPIFWVSSNNGPVVYLWGRGDVLKEWQFDPDQGLFNPTPIAQGTVASDDQWPNTAALSLSANQSVSKTGIIWATMPYSGLANPGPAPGILHAVDAEDPTNELWNSKVNPDDDLGNYAKFNAPTVANGKVYVGTFSNQLVVYGLTVSPDFSVSPSPSAVSLTAGQSADYTIAIDPVAGFQGTISFTCSGLPAQSSCTFNPPSVDLTLGNSATTTLSVVTTAHSSAKVNPLDRRQLRLFGVWLPLFCAVLVGGSRSFRFTNSTLKVCAIFLIIIALIIMIGCGGGGTATSAGPTPPSGDVSGSGGSGDGGGSGGGGGTGGGGGSTGTPSGSSLLTITAASSSTIHTTTVTLNVQ